MINIHEVRIGNYLLVDNNMRRICFINNGSSAESPSIGFISEGEAKQEMCNTERVQAIALTDQLLQELGFIFHEHFKLWQHNKPNGSYSIELDSDYQPLDFAHRPIVKGLKHLHALQNLFYSIQGQELVLETYC